MSALLGFAGDVVSLAIGVVMTLGLCWLILSNWLDDARLILTCVAITAAFYLAGAIFADGIALGSRLLLILGIGVVAAFVARYWLWRDAQRYGPHDG